MPDTAPSSPPPLPLAGRRVLDRTTDWAELASRLLVDLGATVVKAEPAGAALFTDEGRRRFFRTFETRMLTVFSHVPSGQRTWYRRGLLLQALCKPGQLLWAG